MQVGRRIVHTPFPVYVSTREDALDWVLDFYETAEEQGIGVDTETTGLHVIRDRVRFFGIAQAGRRMCAPVRLLPVFKELLEDPNVEKRFSNAAYDMHLLANHGVRVWGTVQDTIDLDHLLDENDLHGLKPTALRYLGLQMTPFSQLFGDVGKVDNEVQTLCEVHDILELHDHYGRTREAHDRATRVMIRLKKAAASKEVLRALKQLDISMRAGCVLDARKILKMARDLNYASLTRGPGGYVSDFVQFVGGPELETRAERDAWRHVLEQAAQVEEAHHLLWYYLLERTDVGTDPVDRLRAIVTDYASLDPWATYVLTDYLQDALADEDMVTEEVMYAGADPVTMLEYSEEKRVPFLRTLWNMERRGFRIDTDKCEEYGSLMRGEIEKIETAIVLETGDIHFNPDSTPQVRAALFHQNSAGKWVDPFGFPPKTMTDGGETGIKMPSTSKDVLEEFAGKGDDLSQLILDHRGFSKLEGTYMRKLPLHVDRHSRIHTHLKSSGARTWRLASANPNLQNIPVRNPVWGPRIRNLFIPGYWGDCDPSLCMRHLLGVPVPRLPADFPMTLIVADYKQLEMRIMAHFSEDPSMISAILGGLDLHCQTVALASERGVPGIPAHLDYAEVHAAKKADNPDPGQLLLVQKRGEFKSTGFGIIYGIGALKLGMQLGLPIVTKEGRNGRVRDYCPTADELIDSYLWQIYPGVGQWIEDTKDICTRDLVVYTIAGHPRRLPDIVSQDRGRKMQAQRQAPNARIQGSAADMANEAMLKCEEDAELRRLGARLLLQVHDELVFEAPDHPDYIEPAKARITQLMENPFPMRVPIEIDIAVGRTWGSAKG